MEFWEGELRKRLEAKFPGALKPEESSSPDWKLRDHVDLPSFFVKLSGRNGIPWKEGIADRVQRQAAGDDLFRDAFMEAEPFGTCFFDMPVCMLTICGDTLMVNVSQKVRGEPLWSALRQFDSL